MTSTHKQTLIDELFHVRVLVDIIFLNYQRQRITILWVNLVDEFKPKDYL